VIPAGLRCALRHLTVLPIGWDNRDQLVSPAVALPWFPVVGVTLGALVALMLVLPLPALPRAALALTVWTALTGALHEDALMDCADAALAIVTRERRLAILKDPHIGAHAATAIVLIMLLRFTALTVTPWMAPLVAATCGRWTMVLTLTRFPAARAEGLGAMFARDARALPATLVALAIVGLLSVPGPTRVLIATACGLGAGLLIGAWLSTRFGGLTGDGHGASGLAAETVALLTMMSVA
jgi:adenosylcobinamide-GDP ribazoletransferase